MVRLNVSPPPRCLLIRRVPLLLRPLPLRLLPLWLLPLGPLPLWPRRLRKTRAVKRIYLDATKCIQCGSFILFARFRKSLRFSCRLLPGLSRYLRKTSFTPSSLLSTTRTRFLSLLESSPLRMAHATLLGQSAGE